MSRLMILIHTVKWGKSSKVSWMYVFLKMQKRRSENWKLFWNLERFIILFTSVHVLFCNSASLQKTLVNLIHLHSISILPSKYIPWRRYILRNSDQLNLLCEVILASVSSRTQNYPDLRLKKKSKYVVSARF